MRRALALVLVAAAGCGDEPAADPAALTVPDPAHARAVARDPYRVTCGDLAQQTVTPAAARLVIHAEFALAQVPELRDRVATLTLNRTGRSVYYAMTELCKGRDEAHRPARAAVAAVRAGRYLAARNRPG